MRSRAPYNEPDVGPRFHDILDAEHAAGHVSPAVRGGTAALADASRTDVSARVYQSPYLRPRAGVRLHALGHRVRTRRMDALIVAYRDVVQQAAVKVRWTASSASTTRCGRPTCNARTRC
jgi:hypothetical protein